jgi:hypothetical protein
MPSINCDTYNAVVWVTSQFSGAMNLWWLNRKTHATLDTFDSLVATIRETSLLPNFRDGAITAVLLLEHGSQSYVAYTQ